VHSLKITTHPDTYVSLFTLRQGKRRVLGFFIRSTWRSLMLYTIVVILVILWLLGLIGHIGGSLIHLVLVVALVVLIFNFLSGRRG